MLVSPPYVRDAYCIRHIDANLWPEGRRVQFQSSDTLDFFVRAFHHFKKGRINRRSMLVDLYIGTARDQLRLRHDLRIWNRTAWNGGMCVNEKHKDDRPK